MPTRLPSDNFGQTPPQIVYDDGCSISLEDMAIRRGPKRALLALGYSGWAPGQLEEEISHNGWLTCDASPELVFATENSKKWEKALATLGIDPLMLSASAGRA